MSGTRRAWTGLGLAALWLCGCYSTRQFKGDGAMTHVDSAWCEYAIEFPPINAMTGGESVFEFTGCPRKTLHVELFLADRAGHERLLDAAGASVKALLVEITRSGDERVVFELDGPLVNDQTAFHDWFGGSPFMLPPSFAHSESARRAAWSYGVGWYRFDPRSTYRLCLSTSVESEPAPEAVWLTPLMWGGGLMQPVNLAQN